MGVELGLVIEEDEGGCGGKCKECNEDGTCTMCKDGHWLENGVCRKCANSGCKVGGGRCGRAYV